MKTPLLLLAALFVVGLTQGQTVVTESDVVRQAENTLPTNNWVLYTRNAGTGTFRTGPGSPPLGTGSFEMSTPASADKIYLNNYDHIGTLLSNVDGMGYATYRDGSSTGSAIQVPSINLVIDFNGSAAGGYAILVFEPVYNTGQGAVTSDVWQTWDAYSGGQAKWWSTKDMPGVCAFNCFVTWDTIVANNPDAVVSGAFGLNLGSGNPNILAAADMLSISASGSGVTYDFEMAAPVNNTIVVTENDLAANFLEVIADPSKWFFYNDQTDVIDNSLGTFVNGPATPPAGSGSAAISVTGLQRRNLATYQFSGTPLASITTLGFSTYNPSAGNGGSANRSAYLNFNVDFDGSDTWQRRLVFLPKDNGAVAQDTWQDWDAINGGAALWRYTDGSTPWPGTAIPGSTPRTWADLLASYPGIRVRVTDSWFGMRVGEPYSNGYSENLDKFVFGTASGTTTFDFEPAASAACSDPSMAPSYAGGYVTNTAGTRAFVKVMAPRGGTMFEFYNTRNLVVGAPETDRNSGTPIAGVTRSGDTFTFSPASPDSVFFPISRADANVSSVAFYLRVTDTCDETVDVDPSFALTGVASEEMAGFGLSSAQPNPVASQTTIRFSLDEAGPTRLSVYDMLGREVLRLVDGTMGEGPQAVRLDAGELPSGVYMLRLEAGGRSRTQTVTVAR